MDGFHFIREAGERVLTASQQLVIPVVIACYHATADQQGSEVTDSVIDILLALHHAIQS